LSKKEKKSGAWGRGAEGRKRPKKVKEPAAIQSPQDWHCKCLALRFQKKRGEKSWRERKKEDDRLGARGKMSPNRSGKKGEGKGDLEVLKGKTLQRKRAFFQ